MNWKQKSLLQRACAAMPAGESIYWVIQRNLGSFKNRPDPNEYLKECAGMVDTLQRSGRAVEGARMMEIGTGRRIDMPIGFYLAGAASVLTIDLHQYLRPELAMGSIAAMRENRAKYSKYFDGVTDPSKFNRRYDALLAARDLDEVFKTTGIDYRSPFDARRTGLPAETIDIQTSFTVFEHIPRQVLIDILGEAQRLLSPNGVAFHHIDLSDHFAHADESISFVNFLQFSDEEWERLAGNQFGYHNRLREDEFQDVYREAGHEVLSWDVVTNKRSLDQLKSGFPLDARFRGKKPEVLAIAAVRVMSR